MSEIEIGSDTRLFKSTLDLRAVIKANGLGKLTREQLFNALDVAAPDIGQLVKKAKPVEWIIPNLLPCGSVILCAGEPKVARKSLLLTSLGLCVCPGTQPGARFLNHFEVARHGKVVALNLEDGETRIARRLKDYNVIQDREYGFRAITSRYGLPYLLEYIRQTGNAPMLLTIDPLAELGIEQQDYDENNVNSVALLIRDYRELAQEYNMAIILAHHYRKLGDVVRGSSALTGAVDGWWNIYHRGEDKPRLLQWVLRDAPSGEIEYNSTYQEGQTISFAAASEVRALTAFSKDAKDSETKQTMQAMEYVEAVREISEMLRTARQPMHIRDMREFLGTSQGARKWLSAVLNRLAEDGQVRQPLGPKGGYIWVAE